MINGDADQPGPRNQPAMMENSKAAAKSPAPSSAAARRDTRPEGKGRKGRSLRSCSMSKKSFQTMPAQ